MWGKFRLASSAYFFIVGMNEFNCFNNHVGKVGIKLSGNINSFLFGLFGKSITKIFQYYFLSVAGETIKKKEKDIGK